MSDLSSETDFGLVMPFVLVQSKGGPYEDIAYTAGYAMGLLDAELRALKEYDAEPTRRYMRLADHAQIDLIAMRHGYTATAIPHDDHHNLYEFARSAQ